GPVLHGAGDGVGDGRVERRALLDGLLEGLEDRLGEALALDLLVEDVDAEQVGDVRVLEVDAVEVVAGAGDGGVGLLGDVGTHFWLVSGGVRRESEHRPPAAAGRLYDTSPPAHAARLLLTAVPVVGEFRSSYRTGGPESRDTREGV